MPFHPFGILLNTLPNGNYTIFHRFQKKQETAVVDSTSVCMDYINKQLDVSKNKDTRKWMAYDGKPLLKWMIWGYHYFRKHPVLKMFWFTWISVLGMFFLPSSFNLKQSNQCWIRTAKCSDFQDVKKWLIWKRGQNQFQGFMSFMFDFWANGKNAQSRRGISWQMEAMAKGLSTLALSTKHICSPSTPQVLDGKPWGLGGIFSKCSSHTVDCDEAGHLVSSKSFLVTTRPY